MRLCSNDDAGIARPERGTDDAAQLVQEEHVVTIELHAVPAAIGVAPHDGGGTSTTAGAPGLILMLIPVLPCGGSVRTQFHDTNMAMIPCGA